MRDEVKNYISFAWCRFRRYSCSFRAFSCTQSCTQTRSHVYRNVQCLSPSQKNQFTPLFASLCFLSLPRASRQIGRPIMANAELLVWLGSGHLSSKWRDGAVCRASASRGPKPRFSSPVYVLARESTGPHGTKFLRLCDLPLYRFGFSLSLACPPCAPAG